MTCTASLVNASLLQRAKPLGRRRPVRLFGGLLCFALLTSVASAQNSNANLSNLVLSAGALNPAFAPNTTSYAVSAPNTTTTTTVTPTTQASNATVMVNGTTVPSGSPSGPIPLNVGPNPITVKVTAHDGTTMKTYTVTVTRAASTNADLSNLTLSVGTLSPPFSSGVTSYTASVANSNSSITVTPTVQQPNATVKVNGVSVPSGSPSGPISLNVGPNPINVVVTAQDGTTMKTYTVTVTRAASSNANLSNLSLSSGALNPAFDPNTTSYTAGVSNSTTSITVTPTVQQPNATVKVNGVSVPSGSPSSPISLNVGMNTITTVVTAQDGMTMKTYTVVVTRASSSNANLSNLTLSAAALNEPFNSNTTSYTANVSNATTSTTVTPTVQEPNASVKVNGVSVPSGNPSGPIALNVGPNPINVVVTAQDGTTMKTYTVVVTRAGSANANLSNLTLSVGALNPAFDPNTTSYTASVSNSTTSITVTPTVQEPNASVKVNGVSVPSGNPSDPISLNVGPNPITAVVTAQDGTTMKTYTVTVTRAASANANLSNLSLSAGPLNPAFDPDTTSYTASVSNSVTSTTVTPTVQEPNATVKVNGASVPSGSASGPISLNVGPNPITTVVTAQDGTTMKTYTVTVTRAASANANLSNLSLSAGPLNPAFNPDTTSYTASASNAVTSTTVTPTVQETNATVTVNGTPVPSGSASGPIGLNVGPNPITTVVTAEDGTTMKTYTVVVTRAGSANANLSDLTLSVAALSEPFDPNTTSYTASVSNATTSTTVTPTVQETNATVTVNGTPVPSGSPSGPISLNVGPNPINVVVTAQDGTMKTYTILVGRASSPSLPISYQIQLQIRADPGGTAFNLPDGSTLTNVTPSLNNSGNVAVKVNGVGPTTSPGLWFGGHGAGSLVFNANDGAAILSDAFLNNMNKASFARTAGTNGADNGLYVFDSSIPATDHLTGGPPGATFYTNPRISDFDVIGMRIKFTGFQALATYDVFSDLFFNYQTETGGDPGSPYSFLYAPAFNVSERIAAEANLDGQPSTYKELRVWNADGSSILIASGDSVAGPVFFAMDNNISMNNENQVAFTTRTSAAASTRRIVVGDGTTTIVFPTVNDNVGFTGIDNFAPAINDQGLVAFRGDDGQATPRDSVFVTDGTTFQRIAGVDDTMMTDAGPRVIGSLIGGVSINNVGDVAFGVQFTSASGGGNAIYVAYARVFPTSVVSRKTHGAAGPFDIDLPLAGPAGVECRTGGANGEYQVVATFPVPVGFTSAVVTSGMGVVDSAGASGNQITVNLTGVADVQALAVTVSGVTNGSSTTNVIVPIRFLTGDTNGNARVNAADVSQTKSRLGQPVDSTNFRSDINANGGINGSDLSLLKSKIGNALP